MRRKIKYADEPIGKLKLIKDFLPSPEEIARPTIRQKAILLKKMNKLLSKSKLNEQDIDKYALTIKKRILRKYKAA